MEEEGKRGIPPIVGSLFSWKSSLTKRRTSEDWVSCQSGKFMLDSSHHRSSKERGSRRKNDWIGSDLKLTFPTAASPSSTSLTLLLGFGAPELSAMARWSDGNVRWIEASGGSVRNELAQKRSMKRGAGDFGARWLAERGAEARGGGDGGRNEAGKLGCVTMSVVVSEARASSLAWLASPSQPPASRVASSQLAQSLRDRASRFETSSCGTKSSLARPALYYRCRTTMLTDPSKEKSIVHCLNERQEKPSHTEKETPPI